MEVLRKLDMEEVIKTMTRWFDSGTCLPRVVRADAGPQFRHSFNNWLDSLGIIRETSSAYNPESNGMVEKLVGDIKRILKKLSGKEDLLQTTAGMNNSVRTDCETTPVELMAGRSIKTSMIGSSRREVDLAIARKKRMEAQSKLRHKLGRGKKSRESFEIGDSVRLQCPKTLKWGTTGRVVATRIHEGGTLPLSYVVSTADGQEFLRNGKFLRLRTSLEQEEESSDSDSSEGRR